jgi:hypothetical protein
MASRSGDWQHVIRGFAGEIPGIVPSGEIGTSLADVF